MLLVILLVVSTGPALAFGAVVATTANRSSPHVDAFRAEADRLGLEVMPDVLYAVDEMPDPSPEAVAQDELVTRGRQTFDGDPADGGLLFWPLLVASVTALSAWTVLGALTVIVMSQRWLRVVAAVALPAALVALWLPPIYFSDTIDVVSYYVD